MRSYRPEELFDADGRLVPELRGLAPTGGRRMSANPHANGGLLRRDLKLPDFRDYAVEVPDDQKGKVLYENTRPLGEFLRDVMRDNMTNFRLFGPDETASNRLQAVYEVSKKVWMADLLPEDADGGELSRDGRVMEMLSEHTLIGWLEGYLLSGRHGFFHTYEAFAHVIDSMFNQHAKWLDISQEPRALARLGGVPEHPALLHRLAAGPQRLLAPGPGLHRSGHQQEPERLPRLSAAGCQHPAGGGRPVPALHRLHQRHRRRQAEAPAVQHHRRGRSCTAPRASASGRRASNDEGVEPDVVMASCGDVATQEALAATALLREHLPDLKVRFVNVVDLYKLQPASEHPHGSTDREFDSLFTTDKPVIFNFHGYPWLIHKLAYRFRNHENLHVRGYKERGNINTPLELAILNQTDRFTLVIDVIDRVPGLAARAAHLKEQMKNEIIRNLAYAHEHGTDREEITNWVWPL